MTRTALRLTIRTDVSELARIQPELHAWLDEWNASERLRYDTELVLEETVRNIIEHGTDAGDRQDIALEFTVEGDFVVVRVMDRGRPFDPRDAARPELSDRLLDRQPGGLGVFLVGQVAEIVDYGSDGDRNLLILRMRDPLHLPDPG
jgi:anti-sigma regulatory factor (Ser/Thr protein kinase)